ncbi:hypothetical protein I4U23_029276 [Adineta vaga]|nr:hypothetical protein I4U23_029276 [Adineta vaga]
MLFQTSTPKKRTLTSLPRSSTPKNFYNPIKDNHHQQQQQQPEMIISEKCSRPMIKLDLLLYRPKSEYHPRQNTKQSWNI